MKISCEIDQETCFLAGLDAPPRIRINIDPAKLPEDVRNFITANLYDGKKFGPVIKRLAADGRSRPIPETDYRLRRPDLFGFFEMILRHIEKDASAEILEANAKELAAEQVTKLRAL
jgi:hypothetical protein